MLALTGAGDETRVAAELVGLQTIGFPVTDNGVTVFLAPAEARVLGAVADFVALGAVVTDADAFGVMVTPAGSSIPLEIDLLGSEESFRGAARAGPAPTKPIHIEDAASASVAASVANGLRR